MMEGGMIKEPIIYNCVEAERRRDSWLAEWVGWEAWMIPLF